MKRSNIFDYTAETRTQSSTAQLSLPSSAEQDDQSASRLKLTNKQIRNNSLMVGRCRSKKNKAFQNNRHKESLQTRTKKKNIHNHLHLKQIKHFKYNKNSQILKKLTRSESLKANKLVDKIDYHTLHYSQNHHQASFLKQLRL